jgi:adenylate kinase family enzyme
VPDRRDLRRGGWVLDAAYGRWLDIAIARVELIVALDFPRWLSLARLAFQELDRRRHFFAR